MKITLTRHGRKATFNISWRGPCNMPGVVDPREWGTSSAQGEPTLAIDRRGRFQLDDHEPDGVRDTHFAGRLGKRSAHGVFRSQTVDSDVACDTGVVHWTARRR